MERHGRRSDGTGGRPGKVTGGRVALVLAIGLATLAVGATAGAGWIAEAAGRWRLATSGNPFLRALREPEHVFLVPAAVLGLLTAFLTPGALLTLTSDRARSTAGWLIGSLTGSLACWLVLSTFFKLIGAPLASRTDLMVAWGGLTLASAALLESRRRRESLTWPLASRRGVGRLAGAAAAVWIWVVGLFPKLFWEDFNLDGIEAFEFARSLTVHLLPHGHIGGEHFGFFQVLFLPFYLDQWFFTLIEVPEPSVRLPFFLCQIGLAAAIWYAVEEVGDGPRPRLSGGEVAVIWLTLTVFAVVQAFSATYDPFFADLAEPGVPDTLMVLWFLLAGIALWRGHRAATVVFVVASYLSGPGALLLVGALFGAVVVCGGRETAWRLRTVGLAAGVCLALGLAYEVLYARLLLGGFESQFSLFNLVRRFSPPNLLAVERLAALVVATGIVPAIVLPWVIGGGRRRSFGTVIGLVAVAYFAVIYAQAWTNLHQLTPAILLAVAAGWWWIARRPGAAKRRRLTGLAAVGAVLALLLSLPPHGRVHTGAREVGRATLFRVGDYGSDYPSAARHASLVDHLFPRDYRIRYPSQPWSLDPLVWVHYAARYEAPISDDETNYVIQPDTLPPPEGFTEIGRSDRTSVFVRDRGRWRRDRGRPYPKSGVSDVYEPILRRTLRFFGSFAERTGESGRRGPEESPSVR